MRWAEMAAFTPVMRAHEGNRPDDCYQFYNDEDGIKRMARLVDIYKMMSPYTKEAVKENHEKGIPVQRPLFLHYEDDEKCYTEQFEYLLGEDVLVAPVWQANQSVRTVYLPKGEWIHLWTGKAWPQGDHTIPAPLGDTPVFYRKDSRWAELMEDIRARFAQQHGTGNCL